jgi:phage tail-like protein
MRDVGGREVSLTAAARAGAGKEEAMPIIKEVSASMSINGHTSEPRDMGTHAACRFYVEIGRPGGQGDIAAVFTEVSGLSLEMQVTEYEEGGTNGFIHKLPGRLKVGNVTLKRGITRSNDFFKWAHPAAAQADPKLGGFKVDRRNISVILYDVKGKPVVRWNFKRAFPVKWTGPQFTADSTALAIETVEIAHVGVTVESR